MGNDRNVANPASPRRDVAHEIQVLRDVAIINARTVHTLGPMPPGGVPAQGKRKPDLPRREPPAPNASPESPILHADPSESDMFKLGNLFKRKPREPWPLWFNDYSFGARCYNTLRCSIVFYRQELSRHLIEPSGQPHSPDWKAHWSAGFSTGENFEKHGFPTPVGIRWTAMDGSQHEAEIDLEEVFPDHLILHNVSRDEVDEDWAKYGYFGKGHSADILLEVNDRTINIYMKSSVMANSEPNPECDPDKRVIHYALILAWTKTY